MKTRYEDYAVMTDQLPCLLQTDLVRSAGHLSDTANWHENIELQYCVSGCGSVRIDGVQYPFSAGDFVAVNANAVHYTHTDGTICYTCLIFDTAFCSQAGLSPAALQLEPHFQDAVIADNLQHLVLEYGAESPFKKAKIQALILELLVLLGTRHAASGRESVRVDASFETVRQAIFYIHTHYAERITLEELARLVLRDRFSLSRDFKRITGQTVVQYINLYRCKRAMALISDGARVNEAAQQCGFRNDSFFSRTFRTYTGKLPSECRK